MNKLIIAKEIIRLANEILAGRIFTPHIPLIKGYDKPICAQIEKAVKEYADQLNSLTEEQSFFSKEHNEKNKILLELCNKAQEQWKNDIFPKMRSVIDFYKNYDIVPYKKSKEKDKQIKQTQNTARENLLNVIDYINDIAIQFRNTFHEYAPRELKNQEYKTKNISTFTSNKINEFFNFIKNNIKNRNRTVKNEDGTEKKILITKNQILQNIIQLVYFLDIIPDKIKELQSKMSIEDQKLFSENEQTKKNEQIGNIQIKTIDGVKIPMIKIKAETDILRYNANSMYGHHYIVKGTTEKAVYSKEEINNKKSNHCSTNFSIKIYTNYHDKYINGFNQNDADINFEAKIGDLTEQKKIEKKIIYNCELPAEVTDAQNKFNTIFKELKNFIANYFSDKYVL